MLFSKSVLLSILASLSLAAPIEKRDKTLQVDFKVLRTSSPLNTTLSRSIKSSSSSGLSVTLDNEYSYYQVDIELGTPAQTLEVLLDTGSSDLWVPGAGTTSSGGTYDSSSSSTYSEVASGFDISYGDGSYAEGDWATETVTVGGATVTKMEFGYGTSQDSGIGILGIGLKGNEASAYQSNAFTYNNFPLVLKNEGLIDSASYSLYLDSVDATTGSILFGGIDSTKYTGDMTYLSLVDIDDGDDSVSSPVAWFVETEGLSSGSKTFTSTSYPGLLDSGTTLFYAPSSIASSVGEKYGRYNSEVGGYTTSCSATGEDFTFKFNGLDITVPFANFLYEYETDKCLFGILDSGADYYILGDSFLRAAYVYYDIDNLRVGLAQADLS